MKIKEELIESVKESRKIMSSIQSELGAIALAELRKQSLLEEYKNQQIRLKKITQDIQDEYGNGEVDLDTGEFIPVK